MEKVEIIYPVPLSLNRRPTYAVVKRLFTPKQCASLVTFAESCGRFYHSGGQSDVRDVDILYLYPKDLEWPFDKIGRAAVEKNVWNFRLAGFTYPMRIQKYGAGGFTNEHMDSEYEDADLSKITAVVPLVRRRDWTGGQIKLGNHNLAPKLDIGDCLLYPSFYMHWVTPVKRGMRITLSAWVSGPEYT
jgi:hypothetical protein